VPVPPQEVVSIPVDPATARVYAEGWQSWSVTDVLPVTAPPTVVTSAESLAIDSQYGAAAPEGVFQGAGLLAVDPGGNSGIAIFGAAGPGPQIPVIQAVLRGGRLAVSADAPVGMWTDDGPGGLLAALGRWGDQFAANADLARLGGVSGPRPIPPVWCSWYQYHSDVTEGDVLVNLEAMGSLRVPVDIVQIDDGYQAVPGDWLMPSGRFRDLPGLVRRITGTGRRAGIWIAPMLVGRSSSLYAAHPDWVVRDRETGEPVYAGNVCRDACTALDLTRPQAAGYLGEVLSAMRGWGIDYFKIDFCYAGACEGVRRDDVSGVQAYRQGLRVIRDAIGPEALLVGCGAPILPSVGHLDAMRVGPDIAASYDPPGGDPTVPAQRNAARNVVARAWQHGRFWVNDPDCLMLRPGTARRESWAALVESYGGVRASGDGIRELDAWGLETTRRLLVPSPTGVFV